MALATALAATAARPPAPRLLWNASASIATGLYRVSPRARPGRGDIVVARLPRVMRELAAERGYLPIDVPLIKRIAAVGGDRICAVGSFIHIKGRRVAARRAFDPQGRAMPWWHGCRVVGPGSIVLLGDDPGSFDSRYFGPVARTQVMGTARLLWRS